MRLRPLLAIALLLLVLAVGCSGDDPPAALPEPTPDATSTVPSHVPGMWVSSSLDDLSAGLSLHVEPGADSDFDAWTISLGSSEARCTPSATPTGWVLTGCRGFQAGVSAVTISIPRAEGEVIHLDMLYAGERITAELSHVSTGDARPDSSGVELVWKVSPSIECEANLGIWADDGLVFAPCSGGVIRIHDATTGRVLGTARPPADGRSRIILEVTYRNGLLYAATATHGLLIFDVTVPAQPRLVGRFEVLVASGSPENVFNIHNVTLSPDGRLVYLINQSHAASDMRIVDISDPSRPSEVGRYTVQTGSLLQGVHDVYLTERGGRTYAYVNRLRMGLEVLDVTDPALPTLMGSFQAGTASHSGWFFEAKGHHYFAHTDEGFDQGLTVLNVDDVTKPQFTSVYRKRPGISIHNIRVVDGIAYIAYYVDGLVVLDLRDPERIAELAYYDTIPNGEERGLFSGAWGVHVDDGLIFMSDMDSGLYAFRLTAR